MPPDALKKPSPVTTSAQLVTYDVSAAEIAATKAKYALLSAETPQGYEEVRLAIAHVRDTRVAIEKRRVELKADALAYGRLVDSEAKRFTALLLEIEEPLKAKKQVIDDEKARIKADAEAEKVRAIEAEIAANRAKEEAELRAKREAEEKRLADERAALEAERKRLAEVQAKIDAERAASAARIEAARKAEQDRIDAAATAERARIDAEREKLAAERRAEEERQRAEREAIEAERRRVAAECEKAERAEFERQAKIRAEREAAEKIERDRVEKARRAAELAALRPDVEKVAMFVAQLRAITPPEVDSPVIRSILRDRVEVIDGIARSIEVEVAGIVS